MKKPFVVVPLIFSLIALFSAVPGLNTPAVAQFQEGGEEEPPPPMCNGGGSGISACKSCARKYSLPFGPWTVLCCSYNQSGTTSDCAHLQSDGYTIFDHEQLSVFNCVGRLVNGAPKCLPPC